LRGAAIKRRAGLPGPIDGVGGIEVKLGYKLVPIKH
jgi:hypothetical protein